MQSYVFISGSTGGLGRIMAVECAERGWNLFITDLNEQKLENFSRSLSHTYGVQVEYAACNMADFDSRTQLIEHIRSSKLRFHMLINIAGIDPEGPFLECSRETIMRVMNINLVSPLDMIRSLTEFREQSKPLHILNVCSMGGLFPMPIKAVYAASKRALIDMSRALREEFKPLGITVTALCPAGMATNEVLVKNMAVQGITGRMTTLQLGYIAASSINKALHGKALYIPGFINRFTVALSSLLPTSLLCKYIHSRWQKTNEAFSAALKASGLKAHT